MSYDKLRYIEQLLSNIYKEGLVDKYKEEIEGYFVEYYGEDSLSKNAQIKPEPKIINQTKSIPIPNNIEDILMNGVGSAFGENK